MISFKNSFISLEILLAIHILESALIIPDESNLSSSQRCWTNSY